MKFYPVLCTSLASSCTHIYRSAELLQERRHSTTPCASVGVTFERGEPQAHMHSFMGWRSATMARGAQLSRTLHCTAVSKHMVSWAQVHRTNSSQTGCGAAQRCLAPAKCHRALAPLPDLMRKGITRWTGRGAALRHRAQRR